MLRHSSVDSPNNNAVPPTPARALTNLRRHSSLSQTHRPHPQLRKARVFPPPQNTNRKPRLVVQEPRHLSAPEGGDLSAQTVPEADVVEPRNRGGDVLVQLAEDGLACRVQSKGGPRGEDVVTVVAPRRLLWCGVCARKKGGWGRREGLITEGKALLPLVAKVTPRTARRLSKKRERERKSERDTLHTQGEACSNNGRPHIKRKQTGKAGNMGHCVRRPPARPSELPCHCNSPGL